jgi:hypothetical protein
MLTMLNFAAAVVAHDISRVRFRILWLRALCLWRSIFPERLTIEEHVRRNPWPRGVTGAQSPP